MSVDKFSTVQVLYPPKYSVRMLRSSFLGLIATVCAAFNGHVGLQLLAVLVTIFSVNHWRNPLKNSWRRSADILLANSSFAYHVYLATSIRSSYVWLAALFWVLAACCYINAVRWGTSKFKGTEVAYDNASKYHVGLHTLATIGNCIFYSIL
mmetsp:Transcript_12637/g.14491  ORF Transcript_12637/g.14491 Transcript_12637/m.14491 type:complete len:152 (+) Transcript_12637:85-540(+)